jgi:hypothetical protein
VHARHEWGDHPSLNISNTKYDMLSDPFEIIIAESPDMLENCNSSKCLQIEASALVNVHGSLIAWNDNLWHYTVEWSNVLVSYLTGRLQGSDGWGLTFFTSRS